MDVFSRTPVRRRRPLALISLGLLLGAGLAAAPAVSAATHGGAAATHHGADGTGNYPEEAATDRPGSAGTVIFTGNCGLLGIGASSQPDLREVNVASGAELWFANRLGNQAVLAVNGESAAEVPDGEAVRVVFHDGPASVTMRVSCLLGKRTGAVKVEVGRVHRGERATQQVTSPPPSPASGSSASDPRHHQGGADSNQPAAPPPEPAAPLSPVTGPEQPTAAAPEQSTEPTAVARPSGPSAAGAPVDGPMSAPGGASPGNGWELGTADLEFGAAHDSVAYRPVASDPQPGQEAIGLLALIATVCVVGVSAGAIRAIRNQRMHNAGAI